MSWSKRIGTQISTIPKKMRKTEIFKLKLKRNLTSMTKLRKTLMSVVSCLLMMTRILRRSSFVYFLVSFKKKKIRLLEIFGRFKFRIQKILDVIIYGIVAFP